MKMTIELLDSWPDLWQQLKFRGNFETFWVSPFKLLLRSAHYRIFEILSEGVWSVASGKGMSLHGKFFGKVQLIMVPWLSEESMIGFVQCTLQIRLCWIALELYSAMARFPKRDILTFLFSKMQWHLLTKISSIFSENNNILAKIQPDSWHGFNFAKVQQDFRTKMQTNWDKYF